MKSDDDCVEIPTSGNPNYYPKAVYKNKRVGAHVLALILTTGEEPNGRLALHSCDNARCINPNHLRWGTPKDNASDRKVRGRMKAPPVLIGPKNRMTKLTEDQVSEIRRLRLKEKWLLRELAEKFDVSKALISKISLGDARKYVGSSE